MHKLNTANQLITNVGKLLVAIFAMVYLSSCNSGSLSDGLESVAQPNQTVGNTPTPTNPTSQTAGQTNIAAVNTQDTPVVAGKSVAFLPVSNAPQSTVTNLTASIKRAATSNQVPIVASVQDGATYQVKGYFSALEDGSGTLLVYVWDILDRGNKRVYRISGQEQSSSKSADPWSSVTPAMVDRVANSTLSQLRSWLASRG